MFLRPEIQYVFFIKLTWPIIWCFPLILIWCFRILMVFRSYVCLVRIKINLHYNKKWDRVLHMVNTKLSPVWICASHMVHWHNQEQILSAEIGVTLSTYRCDQNIKKKKRWNGIIVQCRAHALYVTHPSSISSILNFLKIE